MNPVIDVSEHTDDGASEVSSLSASYRSRERTSDHQFGTTADNSSSNVQPYHQDENDIDITATKRTAQQQQLQQPTMPAARIRKLLDKHDRRDRKSNSAGGFIDSSLDVDDIFGISPSLSVASSLGSGDNNNADSFNDILLAEEGLCQHNNNQATLAEEWKPTVRFQENVEIMKPMNKLIEDDAQTTLTYLSEEKGYDLFDTASSTTGSLSNCTSTNYSCSGHVVMDEEDYGEGESITSISPDSTSGASDGEKEVIKTAMWSIGNVGLGHALGYIVQKVMNRFSSSDAPTDYLQDVTAVASNDQGVGNQIATEITTEAAQEITTEMAAEVTLELVSEAVIQTSTTATATTSASTSASASSSLAFGVSVPPPVPAMSGAE